MGRKIVHDCVLQSVYYGELDVQCRKLKQSQLIRLLGLVVLLSTSSLNAKTPSLIEGVFWQPNRATVNPYGSWDAIGANTFIIQYAITDGKAWYKSKQFQSWSNENDWKRIRNEPWSKKFILGLAGSYDEPKGRYSLNELLQQSLVLIEETKGLRPTAFYFPVEVDPTWTGLDEYVRVLNKLPRPLWISVYSADKNNKDISVWLNQWLPHDVNVFFQDGVGTGVRSSKEALRMYKQLKHSLGDDRVALISEAFRQRQFFSGFRSATFSELSEQLDTYQGERIYIFDGPHYLGRFSTYFLKQRYDQ